MSNQPQHVPAVGTREEKEGGVHDLVPRLKQGGYDPERVRSRREWVEKRTGADLTHTGSFSVNPREMRGNIENPIGVVQMPLGVVGPLEIQGRHACGSFYVPFATTEGALIRSYERGAVTLTRSGGVRTAVIADENRISPSFFFDNVQEAAAFVPWIEGQFNEIQRVAESTTSHGRLLRIRCFPVGRQVILDLAFATGDAQGMNMIVKATDQVCRWIADHYPDGHYLLFSGMCSEKRPTGYLLSGGKGKWVTADAFLPESLLHSYLHCSAREIYQVWHSTLMGHLAAGSIGYNGMYANGLTAMFIALGQDVANVANSAAGITNFELRDDGLYASVTLTSLSVATVGGGTGLPTQRECLEMLGCFGSGKAKKLAEIVAAAILGGEISMGAAIASGEFAQAHERYGRNRPEE